MNKKEQMRVICSFLSNEKNYVLFFQKNNKNFDKTIEKKRKIYYYIRDRKNTETGALKNEF